MDRPRQFWWRLGNTVMWIGLVQTLIIYVTTANNAIVASFGIVQALIISVTMANSAIVASFGIAHRSSKNAIQINAESFKVSLRQTV